jgi:hypothetical protein
MVKTGQGADVAEDELEELNKTTKDADKSSKGFSLTQAGMAAAIAGAGVAIVRQGFELTKLGDEYNRAQIALEAYAGGSDQAALATQAVEDAAGGMIDTLTATQNATKLFSMGLASNAEEAAKLSEIAITLGSAVGRDAKQSFEEFALLLSNQSIPRLDTFGISASQVRARMAELQSGAEGMDRETAFMTATLEIAEDKLQALDEAGFQAGSSFQRMTAMVDNAKLAMGEWLADGFVPALDAFFDMQDSLDGANKRILAGAETWDEYNDSLSEVPDNFAGLLVRLNALNEEEFRQQKQLAGLADAQKDVAVATEDTTIAFEMQGDATRDLRGDQERLKQELNDLHNVMDASIKKDFSDLQTEVRDLQTNIDHWVRQVVQERWDEQTSRMIFGLAEQQLAIDGFTQEELDALAKLAGPEGLGLVDEVGQQLISLIGDAGNALEQQGDQSDIFVGKLTDANDIVGDLATGVDTLGAQLELLPDERTITIRAELTGDQEMFEFRRKGIGFQHGGQFEVTGRPGPDRVPVRAGDQVINAQHGETVTVTPAGVTPPEGGGGGGVTIENVNLNNAIDLSMFVDAIGNM